MNQEEIERVAIMLDKIGQKEKAALCRQFVRQKIHESGPSKISTAII